MTSEPQYQCPKCHQNFPATLIHSHYTDCKGVPQQMPQLQYPTLAPTPYYPQQQQMYQPQPMPQVYVPPVPQHHHTLTENDSFKWCIDPQCPDKHRFLRLKLRGTWFLFVRYGLKLFWIQFLVSIILALGLVSEFHIGR